MKIKFDHINLTVKNLSESRQWYEDLFGFKLVESGESPSGRKFEILAVTDSMICMSEVENFAANINEDETAKYHFINHFGIRVDDENEWTRRIKDHGIKVKYGGFIEYPFSRSWYIDDPSGHEIEVSFCGGGEMKFGKTVN